MKKRAGKNKAARAVIQGISFGARSFLEAAKARARARRRSLSAHVCDLLHAEMESAQAEWKTGR